MENRILKKIMATVKCKCCGSPYQLDNVQVLGNQHGLWFFNVYCDGCRNYFFITASLDTENNSPVSDLTATDILRLQKTDPLTADDVLDMHAYLQDFHGDIDNLLDTETFNA